LLEPDPFPVLTTPAEGPESETPVLAPGAKAKFELPAVISPAVFVASPVCRFVSPLLPLESWAPVWLPDGRGVGDGVEDDCA
jgi:hypothetical protein